METVRRGRSAARRSGATRITAALLVMAGSWNVSAPAPADAQTMPGPVYHDLVQRGHDRLGRDLSRHLDLRSDPSSRDVREFIDRWEREAAGPATGYDWLAVARLWERAGDADRASSALRRADGRIPPATYRFERGRIRFLDGDPRGATDYWLACETADETDAIEAWLDIETLATPDEVAAWDRFRALPAADRDQCAFLRRFWNRRAARSAMDVDARIVQHYERMRQALERYRRRGRVRPDFSVRLGRPANSIFDDRGLLYVRMGEPDDVVSHGGDDCIEPNVSWVYERPEGPRIYHLSPLAGVDDWYLLENLGLVYRCGAWDRSPAVAIPPQLIDIPPEVMYDLYLSRAGVDPAYARIAQQVAPGGMAALRGGLTRMRAAEQLTEEREWTRADGEYAVTTIPERPDVEIGLDFAVEWLSFRSSRPGVSRVWLNGLTPAAKLTSRQAERGRSVRLDVAWVLTDERGDVYRRVPASFDVPVPDDPGDEAGISFRMPLDIEPGEYRWTLVVTDARSPSAGERPYGGYADGLLTVRDMSADIPLLSDVAVSSDSAGTWSPAPGVALSPSPAHSTGEDGIAFVYFEAYNLSPGGQYVTRVRLEPEAGGQDFDLSYPASAAAGGRVATHGYLRVDLSATPPGRYRMTVSVRDLTTGVVTLPVRTDIVVSSPPGG